ncbi:MAG: NHLP family bacteriocin export ABC transporter peptidase/permease/ATPase subunit [Oscillospiraceae bacterium]|jgi:NHLM bacteriocin system ABC transporter peptidase/ATP-binding protein|nr:NHLP family bacteriocin export ABC transporter peptidase/permease/ATPase subunit [Oscillospiraceae bacterium]
MIKRKVPVVIQLEALECGAACLCMISAYYKKWIPLSQVRKDCGVSRDGSVAKNILNAGRSYGFEASGYRLEPNDLDEIKLPAILHWDFNHFVVLTGIDRKKGRYFINDPARGRVTVSSKEFDKSFTGILLQFNPSEKFKPEGKPKSVVAFAKRCLKGSLFPFILMFVISLVGSMINLTGPMFNKIFIDNILSGAKPSWLRPFIFVTLLVLVVKVLIEILKAVYWLKIEGKFAVVSSAKFMWHVLRLPLDFFSQRYIGDIVERQESTARIALTLIKKVAPLAVDIASLVFYMLIMINYSWQLTLIGILATVINMLVINYSSKKIEEHQRAAASNSGKLVSVTYSAIEMIETVKSTGAESGFFERWAGYYTKQNNANVQISKFVQFFGVIPRIIDSLANIILQISGFYLIMRGQFTAGMLMAFQGFLAGFFSPVNEFMDAYQSFVSAKSEMERVDDVFENKIDVYFNDRKTNGKKEDPKHLNFITGHLEIKNITFGYSRLAKPIIENFSLTLEPGNWVALVGGSGSGKSTISKLIMGLYTPWSGEILFDGKPRSQIEPYEFHNHVSMVDQEKIMFQDTVRNNIKMWDDSIEDFSMILSARDSDIHKVIVSRKEGYNHVIREGGKDFSGGQCQRIEIARALASEPTLLVLDEATSALDAKTESIVMENIRNLGCSCVVVAHRLSTVRDCDEIIVLSNGRVSERGTHEKLMEKGQYYKKLVTTE